MRVLPVIYTDNRRVIGIVGPVAAGKDSLALALEARIHESGRRATRVSSGHAYRAVAALMLQLQEEVLRQQRFSGTDEELKVRALARAQTLSAAEVMRLMCRHDLILADHAQVIVDGQALPHEQLFDPRCDELAPLWGFSPQIHGLVSELIRARIEAFDGWVIVVGRSPNREFDCAVSFYLKVWPWIAARRKKKPLMEVLRRNWRDRRGEVGPLKRTPGDVVLRTDFRSTYRTCSLAMYHIEQTGWW